MLLLHLGDGGDDLVVRQAVEAGAGRRHRVARRAVVVIGLDLDLDGVVSRNLQALDEVRLLRECRLGIVAVADDEDAPCASGSMPLICAEGSYMILRSAALSTG